MTVHQFAAHQLKHPDVLGTRPQQKHAQVTKTTVYNSSSSCLKPRMYMRQVLLHFLSVSSGFAPYFPCHEPICEQSPGADLNLLNPPSPFLRLSCNCNVLVALARQHR